MLEVILITLVSALALRDEGGGAAEYLPTTFLCRVIPTATLALLIASLAPELHTWRFFLVLWALLFGAKVAAINPYSQVAINGDTTNILQRRFFPADWVMAVVHLPYNTVQRAKLWGLVATAVRTCLWAPAIAWVALSTGHDWRAWWLIFAPLMAVGYYLGGFLKVSDQRVPAELLAGAILGVGIAGALLGSHIFTLFGA